ncbi:MAG: phosphatase PAP2 family protein [Parashewanella sp.]
MLNIISELDIRGFNRVINWTQVYKLNHLARRISSSGDGHLYGLFAVVCLISHPKGQYLFNLLLMSFLIELPLYLLLKNTIRRVRPCHAVTGIQAKFEPSDKFSLPSGHTAAAFVMATAVFSVLPLVGSLFFIWASGIGISRVALAVHYPTDIIAGVGLGMTSVFLAITYIH